VKEDRIPIKCSKGHVNERTVVENKDLITKTPNRSENLLTEAV